MSSPLITDFVMIYNHEARAAVAPRGDLRGFHIRTEPSASIKELFDLIKVHPEQNPKTGKKSIVMFDEAQLSPSSP